MNHTVINLPKHFTAIQTAWRAERYTGCRMEKSYNHIRTACVFFLNGTKVGCRYRVNDVASDFTQFLFGYVWGLTCNVLSHRTPPFKETTAEVRFVGYVPHRAATMKLLVANEGVRQHTTNFSMTPCDTKFKQWMVSQGVVGT